MKGLCVMLLSWLVFGLFWLLTKAFWLWDGFVAILGRIQRAIDWRIRRNWELTDQIPIREPGNVWRVREYWINVKTREQREHLE